MPTYGYRCQTCQREFDVWQRMSDEPVASCPTCGGSGKRLFFPAGLVFKGSGFYVTDNRRSSSGNGSGEGKAASGSGEGQAASGSGSKPESGSRSGSKTGTSTSATSGSSSGTSSE